MFKSLALSLGIALIPITAMNSGQYAVLVHRANPVESIDVRQLRSIYLGEMRRWPNHRPIVLAEREHATASYQFLVSAVLKTTPVDHKRLLGRLEFEGNDPVIIKTLNSDPAVCKFVFNVPGAIALIDASSVSDTNCAEVKVLKIEGALPGQAGYRLR